MPTITSIKPQKNKKRVNIYLDERFGFGIDLDNFVKIRLRVEQQLTDEEVSEIVRKAEFQKTFDKLLKFAALRPRSEKEFKVWLKKHKVHASLHEELFNRLKRLDFSNDRRFATWWVEQRTNFRPKPKRILNQELRIKGIKKELIDDVLEDIKIDEVAMAKRLLEKKKYMWKKDDLKARKKMSDFLLRRGFSWDLVNKVVKGLEVDE